MFKPIIAATCEDICTNSKIRPLIPTSNEKLDLFEFHDPFGLRRAIVPVLMKESDGLIRGIGTAFHIDGWGTFLTADHVVETVRHHLQVNAYSGQTQFLFGPNDVYPLLLLSVGVVFGTVGIPPEAVALVGGIYSMMQEQDDPIAVLQGKRQLRPESDLAVMQLATTIPKKMKGTVPVRLSGWSPRCGESVVALGFPELNCQALDEENMRYLLSEGMYAAYGRIIGIHPCGRGSDLTPIIELDAYSGSKLPPIPDECCHPFHFKAATDSG